MNFTSIVFFWVAFASLEEVSNRMQHFGLLVSSVGSSLSNFAEYSLGKAEGFYENIKKKFSEKIRELYMKFKDINIDTQDSKPNEKMSPQEFKDKIQELVKKSELLQEEHEKKEKKRKEEL